MNVRKLFISFDEIMTLRKTYDNAKLQTRINNDSKAINDDES